MAEEKGALQAMEIDRSQIISGAVNSDKLLVKQSNEQEDAIKENGIDGAMNTAECDNSDVRTNGPKDGHESDNNKRKTSKESVSSKLSELLNDTEDNKSPAEKSAMNTKKEQTSTEANKISDSENNKSEESSDTKDDKTESSSNAEQMEVDEDSNAPESVSNISAPVSVDTDSKQASLLSEDNSRDSVGSASMKSTSDAELSSKNGFIGKVKDDEGEDILITLNDNKNDETDQEDSQGATADCADNKSPPKEETDSSTKEENFQATQKETNTSTKKENYQATPKGTASSTKKENSQPTPTSQTASSNIPTDVSHLIPPNAQVIKQGDKIGYLTKVGNQNVFVPVTSIQTPKTVNQNATPKSTKTPPVQIKLEDLKPKSSLEMIELMRWELFNRVPDNFNWSVAFHPKKEELSTITAFLLELGHDVVKEAVYKDIIQIQTKKKENGDLKDNEIESLEKMKTVYDNTKKKVEHLFLDQESCDKCKFKTESNVVLSFHKDFPHYDPPWDTSKGMMRCSYCKYSTRVGLQFVLHMETMHKAHAKFPEKEHLFNCELCPLSTSTKNKLDKHRQKCEKHFKLGANLQPYFHDVNFCMKNMYYKPRRPPPPKPSPQPTPQQTSPAVSKAPPRTPVPANIAPRRPSPVPQKSPQNVQDKNNSKPIHPPIPKLQPPARPPVQSTQSAKLRSAQANVPNFPQKPAVPLKGGRHTTNKEMQGFEVCELCGGYVKDRQALRIHFYYAHKVEMPQAIFARPTPPLICDVCQAKFWTTQGLSKHKSTLRHFSSTGPTPAAFGTNQMCFMCMKKVPNLFSHVEQVHGMSMKDLVAMKKCIMCGVTANDKRSLETHLATAHGILMKATDLLGSEKNAARPTNSPQPQQQQQQSQQQQQQQALAPKNKSSNLARQNLCVFCQIQFADNIQLTMHCIKVHATCNGCGMVVASTKHLMYHSCKVMKRKCIICGLKDIAPEVYAVHVKSHVKPCNVKVDKLSEEQIDGVKEKIKKEYKPQVISLDSDEDSEPEIFDKKASENADEKESSSSEAGKKGAKINGESQDTKLPNGGIESGSVEKDEIDNRSEKSVVTKGNQSSKVDKDSEIQESKGENDMDQSENSSDSKIENNVNDVAEHNIENSDKELKSGEGSKGENEMDQDENSSDEKIVNNINDKEEPNNENNENKQNKSEGSEDNRKRKHEDNEQPEDAESEIKRVKTEQSVKKNGSDMEESSNLKEPCIENEPNVDVSS